MRWVTRLAVLAAVGAATPTGLHGQQRTAIAVAWEFELPRVQTGLGPPATRDVWRADMARRTAEHLREHYPFWDFCGPGRMPAPQLVLKVVVRPKHPDRFPTAILGRVDFLEPGAAAYPLIAERELLDPNKHQAFASSGTSAARMDEAAGLVLDWLAAPPTETAGLDAVARALADVQNNFQKKLKEIAVADSLVAFGQPAFAVPVPYADLKRRWPSRFAVEAAAARVGVEGVGEHTGGLLRLKFTDPRFDPAGVVPRIVYLDEILIAPPGRLPLLGSN